MVESGCMSFTVANPTAMESDAEIIRAETVWSCAIAGAIVTRAMRIRMMILPFIFVGF